MKSKTIMTARAVGLRAGALALLVIAATPAVAQTCLKAAEGIARATEWEDISSDAKAIPRVLDHNATDLFEVDCGPKGAITGVRMRPLYPDPLRQDYLDLTAAVIIKLAPRAVKRDEAATLVQRCMTAPGDGSFAIKGKLSARCGGSPRALALTPR